MGSDRAVTPVVVRKVALLARLRLPEEEIPLWSDQLSRIVSYIDQIERIPEEGPTAESAVPPTPLRPDEPRPGGGRTALEANAARQVDGFGVVPRVVGSGE
jgi:aspartyl-tRNA(Asn)/glutamyl-tRNA(Gln) amidotransferase subunit C